MSELGPSFMKIWRCGSSPQNVSQNTWMQLKNVNGVICLSNFWNFFSMIQMISCHDWWPCTKPGYITMIRRQSNNHWSGSIVAHPTPKKSECKNPLEKFSPRFFGIKTASSSLIIFQMAKLSMQRITHLCCCNWRTFWRKRSPFFVQRGGHCCCRDLVGWRAFWIFFFLSGLQNLEQRTKKCIELRGDYLE